MLFVSLFSRINFQWLYSFEIFIQLIERCFLGCNRRPTALQDRTRDSDDDDYQDRDYDVAALANNLSQAFRYGIYSHDEIDEVVS